MPFISTKIKDVVIFEPRIFTDDRGYFFETYNEKLFNDNGITAKFVQDNQSKSSYGVIRGLHFQKGAHAQAKLVRVLQGSVLDVAVDLRKGSETYGKHVAVELSDVNNLQLFIPRGFAHGFSVLSRTAVFAYKCDNLYCKESEGGIDCNDPDLGIDWQIPAEDRILSEKDKLHPLFKDFETCF
ncbi:MAG TPA: dTDP-4-dehydrorhamnose 3,5-epimerase [Alphaproteobacteria bacterium]|nr:dTDP-4-dehydrorhamnose 3,5-epimerase [Alphaproteobacteria bacterium]